MNCSRFELGARREAVNEGSAKLVPINYSGQKLNFFSIPKRKLEPPSRITYEILGG